ncbi:MAG: hypothetical protein M1840_005192 [Geoglossum simile]|nr:MAG: hypothetical protein M1840_005192 [Geoglossum simile]
MVISQLYRRHNPADSDTIEGRFGYSPLPLEELVPLQGRPGHPGVMDSLVSAIWKIPIIDHHAHNLLLPSNTSQSLLSITSEARQGALGYAESTLAHIRAVKQLAEVLGCDPNFEAVKSCIEEKRTDDAWLKKCFSGIECVMFDDGLDGDSGAVYPYDWHDRLTRSKCRRIVRIEPVAEKVLADWFRWSPLGAPVQSMVDMFSKDIKAAIADPDVAGFKSVICYRTGLSIPVTTHSEIADILTSEGKGDRFTRLNDKPLGSFFVHLTAQLLDQSVPGGASHSSKPFQFHTGLGDNDLSLQDSSPSQLQPFIEKYPRVPIVLLHAGYPFTKEAGYLASVYENAYMDIGEVFPMISRDGQERVIKEALELCPTEKLMWSTDGHWFPETFLLAVLQAREGMEFVLTGHVRRGTLTTSQAIRVVEDVFFNTSNKLYDLKLDLQPSPLIAPYPGHRIEDSETVDPAPLILFLSENPSTKYLRLQWVDYTATNRVRILPIKHALSLFQKGKSIGITKAVLGLLQDDTISPGFTATGEYTLFPCFDSLRRGERPGYATVQCEFREKSGEEVPICPRTVLRKAVERAASNGREFLVGFEIEVVFMTTRTYSGNGGYGGTEYGEVPVSEGHAWSTSRALHNSGILSTIEAIIDTLEKSGIVVQQFHPESSPGQYEFVTGPLPPLQAADALLATREIISTTAATHLPGCPLRATFTPRPYTNAAGTGAHIHISMTPETDYRMFYAGVLKYLRAIVAITYPNAQSYGRVCDGIWAGGTWVAWGTQNRETPLRKISGSHWEVKCVDGFANTYLALSAILCAGLQGLLDKEELVIKDCAPDPSTLSSDERKELGVTEGLPRSFEEALEGVGALEKVLGREVVECYQVVKGAERKMLESMVDAPQRMWLIERY